MSKEFFLEALHQWGSRNEVIRYADVSTIR